MESSDSDNDNYNDGNKSVGDSKSCEKCKVRIKSSMKKFTSKNYIEILCNYHKIKFINLRFFNPYGKNSFNKKAETLIRGSKSDHTIIANMISPKIEFMTSIGIA